MELDLAQLRALDATVREGPLEAAARALHVTPSAVSQRLRALEVATGRVLLVRSKPVQVTDSGRAGLRLAREGAAPPAAAAAGRAADRRDRRRARWQRRRRPAAADRDQRRLAGHLGAARPG